MRKKEFSVKSLLLGTLSLALCACGNDSLEPGAESDGPARLNISVSVPASESIVVKSLTRAATVPDEANEAEIKTLYVHLFKKGNGTAETDYTLFQTYTFTPNGGNGATGKLNNGAGGVKTCSIDIDPALMGKDVRVVLNANDNRPSLIGGTLANFRAALATAVIVNDVNADKLVGEGIKGFPMSAVCDQDVHLSAAGVSCSAVLVRSVARLDIRNNAPGLTIKGVSLSNVNSMSCLFGKADRTQLNIPSGVAKIGLKPLSAYAGFLTQGGIAYDGPISIVNKDKQIAFYLYEQSVTGDGDSPVLKIDYEIGDGFSRSKTGSVTVKFKKDNKFVSVRRNTLYTVVLGDGSSVSAGNVRVAFRVLDWFSGEEIDTTINPGAEED